MENNYNLNKLVSIIYGEASFEEYFKLDEQMQADPAIRIEFRRLYDSFQELDKISLSPSKNVINNILQYSKDQLKPTMS